MANCRVPRVSCRQKPSRAVSGRPNLRGGVVRRKGGAVCGVVFGHRTARSGGRTTRSPVKGGGTRRRGAPTTRCVARASTRAVAQGRRCSVGLCSTGCGSSRCERGGRGRDGLATVPHTTTNVGDGTRRGGSGGVGGARRRVVLPKSATRVGGTRGAVDAVSAVGLCSGGRGITRIARCRKMTDAVAGAAAGARAD